MSKSPGKYYPGMLLAGLLLLCLVACDAPVEKEQAPSFNLLRSDVTGLEFTNDLTPTIDLNVFNFMYFYNGGGVAAEDFNNDGLIDLYFTANMGPNKLFLNTGELQFRDVTDAAEVAGIDGWTTGVCAVDINNDGMMDLYVGQMGEYRKITGRNLLFVCTGIDENGVPHYTEQATAYGLDLKGFATQAAFFDYDRDGDLDMYQMQFSLHQNGTFGQRYTFDNEMHPTSGDKLLRNDNGKYVDVTEESGIYSSVIGYGLGIVVSDINNDGWPDLYIGNDFHENDYLYLNQQNGTFREVLTEQLQHTSRFSMGVDAADINNDGYKEIFSADMHPYDPQILKRSLGEDGYSVFQFKLGYGYNHQYARNTLQLNNGNSTFSDIGIFAGVHATDWSWAPVFTDFNNDGFRDLFVSNGIPKRMNDIDYVNFAATDEIQARIQFDEIREIDLALIDRLPEIKLENKFFLNNQDLTFTDIKGTIAGDLPGFSNGAVVADLDNDGDLDIVTNNIYDAPFVYENLLESDQQRHFLKVIPRGMPGNLYGIGATLIVEYDEMRSIYENFPVRGYQSSMPHHIHAGFGSDIPKRLTLLWPDGTYQLIDPQMRDTIVKVEWTAGLPAYQWKTFGARPQIDVQDITARTGLDFVHEENPFIEFNREALIPHMTSSEGPAVAIGDVNGDNLEDIFFGGAKRRLPGLFLQTPEGGYQRSDQPSMRMDSVYEDVDAAFIDVDSDGDADLVVASGGNEFREFTDPLAPRIYKNDGGGNFSRDKTAFDSVSTTASCVLPFDFTGDGHIDLFIGSRARPWKYGEIPRSYLLENDGNGKFADVTATYSTDLAFAGFVKNGAWADMDGDGNPDLVLALEWGPMTIYFRRDDGFVRSEVPGTNGWWNFVLPADYDADGDIDLIAGNLGKNAKLKPSLEKPVTMYVNDFDDNGQREQITTYYLGDDNILLPTFAEITKQMPALKKNFLYAKDFASASLEDLVGTEKVKSATVYHAYVFANSYFENDGSGQLLRSDLPTRLQFSPLMTGIAEDVDKDGDIDVMLWGNYHENNIELGRYDADYGTVVYNSGNGFSEGDIQLLNITGQVRRARLTNIQKQQVVVLARNDDSSIVLSIGTTPAKEGI